MHLLGSTPIKISLLCVLVFALSHCSDTKVETKANSNTASSSTIKYPSDVIPFFDKWKILLGDGTHADNLIGYQDPKFFYSKNDGKEDWVVYKTPNSGTTSKNSSNTRTELHEKQYWLPKTGGSMSGTLKVMHVSTSGDARVNASYSVVVGQIHSDEGHKNEPLKIFYKKFPGHKKGSVYWNYEINTKGDNKDRWDFSTAVWGYDMSVVGSGSDTYPKEPENGIALGEEFSYTVNVYEGIMYLSFTRAGQEPVTFIKNLIKTEYPEFADLPQQILDIFVPIGRKGTERLNAYEGEMQFFKQGAYNQTNGKDPKLNMVWCSGADIYEGDIDKQYENGSYVEVWFKGGTIGPAMKPK